MINSTSYIDTALVFINGEINADFCAAYIKKHYRLPTIYCADGAYQKIRDNDFLKTHVEAVIGDFDSCAVHQEAPCLVYEDQNNTDFEKILMLLQDRGYKEVHIFGANGGEIDHALGNLSIMRAYQSRLSLMLIDQYSKSFLVQHSIVLQQVRGKMISIVPLFQMQGVTLEGVCYPLQQAQLTFGGLLSIRNHAIADTVRFSCRLGMGLISISHDCYHQYSDSERVSR